MILQQLYKRWIPLQIRNAIAGMTWVNRLRVWQLMAESHRLATAARVARKPDGKIKVAFFVQRRALWPNHASIYEAMKADPSFEVSVIVTPKRGGYSEILNMQEYRHLKGFLEDKGIPFFPGYDEESRCWVNPLKFGLPDVVFIPQPFTKDINLFYGSEFWKSFAKIAYVPYGITLANLPGQQNRLPFFYDCWRIFVESEFHWDLFQSYNPGVQDRLVVTGHPKLDLYLKPPNTRGLWKMPTASKRIIWAPHFTVADNRTPHTFSNFFAYYELFLDCARHNPEIEWVMRPHPELFTFMVTTGQKTQRDADEYRRRFNALPNGQVYEGGDIFEMFKESDALILDSICFLAEYLPTGKPICFLESQRRQKLNPVGEALLATYYKAWNAEDIKRFVREVVLADCDPLKAQRMEAMRKHLFLPKEGTGTLIKHHILSSFKAGLDKDTHARMPINS